MAELEQSLSELRRRIARGTPAPKLPKAALELGVIETVEKVFQHRNVKDWVSGPHVENMVRYLNDNPKKMLEAIKVFWIGDAWVCIDGHHRLDAYTKTFRFDDTPIPVRVFTGNLDEAVVEALRGNSRNKLQMSSKEKSDSAWRLTVTMSLSKSTIAEVSQVSERTIATMRNVKDSLKAAGHLSLLSDMTWDMARMQARRIDGGLGLLEQGTEKFSYDAHVEVEALKIASRLVKTFGKRMHCDPAFWAAALHMCNESLPRRLNEHWIQEGYLGEEEEEEEQEF